MNFLSGERDLRCFLCAAALFNNISILSSGERDCRCFCCSAAFLTKACAFPLGERDSQYPLIAAEFVYKFCLKKHSACFFIWAGVSVLRTFCNLHAQLLPYFSHSCMNILCLFWVYFPLFIFLFRKLAGATCIDPKEASIENKPQWQAIEMPNNKWSVQQAKNKKQKAGDDKQ